MSHPRPSPDSPTLLQRLLRSPLFLGAIFSTLLFAAVIQISVDEHERDFALAAEGAGVDFREHLREGEGVINNVVLFFNASSHVSEEEFALFADSQFSTHLDIKAVYFLAHSGAGGSYAGAAAVRPLSVKVPSGADDYPLHLLYRTNLPGQPLIPAGPEGWQAPRTIEVIGEAIARGGVTMGGMLAQEDGSIAFSQYRAVYDAGGRLLGVVAVLFRPADVLAHITEDYRVNATLRIGERVAGAFACCREQSEPLLPSFAREEGFELRGTHFQLDFSKGLAWEELHMKVAVMAFIIGVLLSVAMQRLRVANAERTRLLLERNRTIRRQVDEQTRALRQANAELEQEKAALDEHAIVSITDTTGKITYVNEKFCEISGYSSEELLGGNHRIVKSERHDAEFYAGMWSTISQGRVWQGLICNRSKGGEEYWVNSTIVPFLDERGMPYQYVSIRTDVTQMVNIEAALARQEQGGGA